MKKQLLFVSIFILLLWPSKAQAYLDPGSGSFIIQVVIASLVGGSLFFKNFWSHIKNVFNKKNKNSKNKEESTE